MLYRFPSLPSILDAAILGLSLTAPPLGQNYPSRPIRIVVPFPAGGPTDTIARAVGFGVKQVDMPVTPQKIWRLMHAAA